VRRLKGTYPAFCCKTQLKNKINVRKASQLGGRNIADVSCRIDTAVGMLLHVSEKVGDLCSHGCSPKEEQNSRLGSHTCEEAPSGGNSQPLSRQILEELVGKVDFKLQPYSYTHVS
jgi:hypothetical protein